jgi:secreted trypsin-like serine protease
VPILSKESYLLALCASLFLACTVTAARAEDQSTSLLDIAIERSKNHMNDRIIGGSIAHYSDNPWQVALVYSGSQNNLTAQFCGGSIIEKHWVITAAHCIDQRKPKSAIEVLSGTDSLISGGVRSQVEQIIVHENFSSTTVDSDNDKRHDFDIALLEIAPGGQQLMGVRISGPSKLNEMLAVGAPVRITGWGETERNPQPTFSLQGVDVHYVDTKTCNAKKSYDNRISENMLCAGEQTGGKDACHGDSGGPATSMLGTTRVLVGLSSWGIGCADADRYGVYTRVSQFRDWVKIKTGNAVAW